MDARQRSVCFPVLRCLAGDLFGEVEYVLGKPRAHRAVVVSASAAIVFVSPALFCKLQQLVDGFEAGLRRVAIKKLLARSAMAKKQLTTQKLIGEICNSPSKQDRDKRLILKRLTIDSEASPPQLPELLDFSKVRRILNPLFRPKLPHPTRSPEPSDSGESKPADSSEQRKKRFDRRQLLAILERITSRSLEKDLAKRGLLQKMALSHQDSGRGRSFSSHFKHSSMVYRLADSKESVSGANTPLVGRKPARIKLSSQSFQPPGPHSQSQSFTAASSRQPLAPRSTLQRHKIDQRDRRRGLLGPDSQRSFGTPKKQLLPTRPDHIVLQQSGHHQQTERRPSILNNQLLRKP